jgi:hypothetical protein
MDIGKMFVDAVVNYGLATVIIVPTAVYLYTQVRRYIKEQKVKFYDQVDKIVNPDVRALAMSIISNVEEAIGSEAGHIKFDKAVNDLLRDVPVLVRPIAEKFLQGVYDELKEKRKI